MGKHKNRNDATTRGLWAPIITSRMTSWVSWPDVRMTRRAAREAFLQGVSPEGQKEFLDGVRFARVVITEDKP